MSEVEVKSEIKVTDLNATENKKPRAKRTNQLKHSNYYLTLNTNKQFLPSDEDLCPFIDKFETCISEIFQGNNIKKFIVIKNDDTFSKEKFKEISTEAVIELGNKKPTVHAHCLVKIAHRSKVGLDYEGIRNKVIQDMELENCYLKATLYRNASDNLEKYLNKDVK